MNIEALENNIYLNEIERIQKDISILALFSKNLEDNFSEVINNFNFDGELSNSIKRLAIVDDNLKIPFNYNNVNSLNESNKIRVLEEKNKYILKKYNELQNRGFFRTLFKK